MTEDEWLDALLDEPNDDLRRFAFADWLEEHGDHDRAEFIRLQVGLSRVSEREQDPAQAKRAAELLDWHRAEWLGPLVEVAPTEGWFFTRGIPEALHISDVLAVQALASSPHLARLTQLDLHGNRIGAVGAGALASSPHLARLTSLNLDSNEIGVAGAEALASSPHLGRLTTLNLDNNMIEDTGAQALGLSARLAQLSRLQLFHNWIGAAGAEALASSPHLGRLTVLNLARNWIGVVERGDWLRPPI